MPHIDTLFDDPYIKAGHLGGEVVTATIAKVEKAVIENGTGEASVKPLIYFEGVQFRRENGNPRPMVCNKTNARTIAALYGEDVSAWIGKKVMLYAVEVEAFGETKPAIRVKQQVPSEEVQA